MDITTKTLYEILDDEYGTGLVEIPPAFWSDDDDLHGDFFVMFPEHEAILLDFVDGKPSYPKYTGNEWGIIETDDPNRAFVLHEAYFEDETVYIINEPYSLEHNGRPHCKLHAVRQDGNIDDMLSITHVPEYTGKMFAIVQKQ